MRSAVSASLMLVVAALLLASAPNAAMAQGDPLELIAPGLTASGLCPLANSKPQVAINAIAQGATAAYNKGGDAPGAYANALGVAVGAAASNGCIDAVFEIVNQAIIKGGYPVEVVVGRALAKGTAQGVDSATGEVLARATAVVICRGGESASACARAWSQAVKMDGNGCLVLVKAYAYAKAQCGPGYATAQASSTVFREPLGVCKAPEFGAPVISVTQGTDGHIISTGSTFISQSGQGVSTVSVGTPSGTYTMTRQYGRKMLAAKPARGSSHRKMLQFGGYFPFSATTNAAATNNGWANGPVTANSASQSFGGSATSNAAAINNGWANGPVTANSFAQGQGSATSNAVAINNGVANGGVTANANAVAYGRR